MSLAEQQAIADTFNSILTGQPYSILLLDPHGYNNWPSKNTGAILPEPLGKYTTYRVPSVSDESDMARLIMDKGGHIFYTNNHYKSFYPVDLKATPRIGGLMMKIISLDASFWKTVKDFYDAVLSELGAPEWHGANLNALVESMVWGGINRLEPPYKIEIVRTKNLPEDVNDEIREIADFTIESCVEFRERKGRDAQVSFEIVS